MTTEAKPAIKLPDPATLWPCQISQTHCALCRRPLVEIVDDRLLGEVEVGEGIHRRKAELWGCAPTCATAVPPRKAADA
jgi:hypothetical protein